MHSQNSSTHLSTVQELLNELDQMKNKGLSAQERLDFILDQGSNFVEEFSVEDAFDLEHRARSKRLEQLKELGSTLRTHTTQWEGAPVEEPVKEAAGKLLGHLNVFVKKAEDRERKSEIEMLSALWEWAPDVSEIWPGHHSRPRPKAIPIPEEVKELLEKKTELYDELEAKKTKTPPGEWIAQDFEELERIHGVNVQEELCQQKCFQEGAEEDNTDSLGVATSRCRPRTQSTKETAHYPTLEEAMSTMVTPVQEPKSVDGRFPRKSKITLPTEGDEMKVVGKVTEMPVKPGDHVVKDPQTDLSPLVRDAWTEALREMTTDDWSWQRTMKGMTGEKGNFGHVLLWTTSRLEARLEITDEKSGFLTKSEPRDHDSLKRVQLWVQKPDGTYYKHSETMTPDEVEKMNLDPIPFLKRMWYSLPHS